MGAGLALPSVDDPPALRPDLGGDAPRALRRDLASTTLPELLGLDLASTTLSELVDGWLGLLNKPRM